MNREYDNQLSGAVIGAAIKVHRQLGPGLDEPIYQSAMEAQLTAGGVPHHPQFPLPLYYKNQHLDCGYRPDFVIPNRLVVELKVVEVLLPIHEAQLFTYLRLTGIELGLLLNFDVPVLKQGIRRRIFSTARQTFPSEATPRQFSEQAFDSLSGEILAAAVEVHRELGPGLLPSAYEESLCYEMTLRGVRFERKKPLQLFLDGLAFEKTTAVRLVVGQSVPVECLSVPELNPLHEARLLGRLRQGRWPYGLLLNFNVNSLPHGIRRIVNPEFRR